MSDRTRPFQDDQPRLPVDGILPRLLAVLTEHSTALLQAPPGSGKTTRVPPALLDAEWVGENRILMLEPRRLATRAAARFMAGRCGEPVGRTVGYRTRLDTRVSARTRIEVVTEGILIRLLQRDPELPGVAAVLFDEFHERSLDADLGLALVREVQQSIRSDLRLLLMSATLETGALAALLDNAPVLTCNGLTYPVETRYRAPGHGCAALDDVPAAIRESLRDESGSILVFLPGEREIRQTARAIQSLASATVTIRPLYGALPPDDQDAAIEPAPAGMRKVVLATSIAETSLTIEGIRVVIDSGLARHAEFDPGADMSRLVTRRVSQATAEQRRGRAGRLEPGLCIRLWRESEQPRLARHSAPEIASADLAPLVLELAGWGTRSAADLCWLDPPPEAHWNQAVELLQLLDALDADGTITATGRAMLATGVHPRLAHMLVLAETRAQRDTAAWLAAVLSERDPLGRAGGADLELRLSAVAGRTGRWRRIADLARRLGARGKPAAPAGPLLALAYPDRIARKRPGGPARFRLANGRGAWLPDDDPLGTSEWLVAAELDGRAREARIFLAAAIREHEVEDALGSHIRVVETAEWDDARGTVVARRQRRLGELTIEELPAGPTTAEAMSRGLLDAVRRRGLDALDGFDSVRQWCARVELVRNQVHPDWPAFDPDSLERELDDWLAPFLAGLTHWREVQALDIMPALTARLGHVRIRELDRLAPTSLELPTGTRARIDYSAEGGPVLAVKLQALFGQARTPRLIDHRVPLTLHLLSPAGRALAVTADLESFWQNAYPEVAKDMRGRYPKHPWPDDPLNAKPTLSTKRRGRAG